MSAAMMAATAADVAELLEIQSTTELATAAVAKALARVVKLSRENDALTRLNAQQSRVSSAGRDSLLVALPPSAMLCFCKTVSVMAD